MHKRVKKRKRFKKLIYKNVESFESKFKIGKFDFLNKIWLQIFFCIFEAESSKPPELINFKKLFNQIPK